MSGPAPDIWELFERIVDLPEAEQQQALDELARGDENLRSKLVGMLAADLQTTSLMDRPVLGQRGFDGLSGDETTLIRHSRLEPGHRIGPYRILRLLDEGGMGAVYLAARDDDSFSRRAALEVVRAGMETSQILARLETERRILASLQHPYISRLYDGGSTPEGLPYFVLEYIEGDPIDVYCRKNALSLDERLALFVKVCEVVQFAHQSLVIHRDLEPRNILVTREGDPKLLDFGIAKLINPDLAGGGTDPTDPTPAPAIPRGRPRRSPSRDTTRSTSPAR